MKAIIPRFPDFDPYATSISPAVSFTSLSAKVGVEAVKEMDLNVPRGNPPRGVKPVDDGSLLEMTIDARRDVPGVFEGLSQVTFRDDRPEVWGVSMLDWSIHTHLDDLERAGTPMFTWGGWFDAGTAQGVLRRFTTLSNPQKRSSVPGAMAAAITQSPYQLPDFATTPTPEDQLFESLCYFDHYLGKRAHLLHAG